MGAFQSKDPGSGTSIIGWLAGYLPACLLPVSAAEAQPEAEAAAAPAPAASSSSILVRALQRKQEQDASVEAATTTTSPSIPPPKEQKYQPPARAIDPADLVLRGRRGETIVKTASDLGGPSSPPQPFAIDSCEGCDVFVLAATAQVTVDDCVGCRLLLLGPCAGSLFLRDCRDCVVVAACQQLRTRGCHGLDLRLFAATSPSLEASAGVRLGCYPPFSYEGHPAQFAAAELDPLGSNRWWDVYDFTPPDEGKQGAGNYTLVAEAEGEEEALAPLGVKPLPAEVAACMGFTDRPDRRTVPFTPPPAAAASS